MKSKSKSASQPPQQDPPRRFRALPAALLALACLSTVGMLIAVSQESVSQEIFSPPPTPAQEPEVKPERERRLAIDRETWDIIDLDDQRAEFKEMNTPELRLARFKATLMLENPEEHEKLFPHPPEEIERARVSAEMICNPISLEEFLLQPRSDQELTELLDAIEGSLNPKTEADEIEPVKEDQADATAR